MRGRPDVTDFVLFRRGLGARAYPDFYRQTRSRRFDLVLDVHPYLKAGLVTRALDAPVRLGYDRARARDLSWLFTTHRIPARPPSHVQDQYFEFLEHLGVPVAPEWDFHFTAEERAARRAFFGAIDCPVLAIVLRSSTPGKDWILDRYARVIDVAEGDLGFRSILVGGDSERERADAEHLRSLCRFAPGVELGHDLRRLAWLLDGSSLVVSPDTGPLHIAVALGTPTIGLYGRTDPKRSGPYRDFEDLLIDRYTRTGETRPSRRRRSGNMERITVEDVLDKLELARVRYLGQNVSPGELE
jgi:heptosyltransferase I